MLCWHGALLLGAACATAAAPAEATAEPPLETQLHERVLSIPINTERPVSLQLTLFTPDGPGPFPLAVVNHGKAAGPARAAPRYRSFYEARYFVSRGYAVALPMLRGFAGSGGEFDAHGCRPAEDGLHKARDIRAVIDYLIQHPEIVALDAKRIVVLGQSYGGWNTLALGTLQVSGVRGLINVAGGRNTPGCPNWPQELAKAAGLYGAATRIPSIWFYGDNDSKFARPLWQDMHQRYRAAGGPAELVAYGPFMKDAHRFFSSPLGLAIWAPKLDAFLAKLGLPSQNLRPELLPTTVYPAATSFADVDDVQAVPLISEDGRREYQKFLTHPRPRVFVIASQGSSVSSQGGLDPLGRALTICKQNRLSCRAYAVDDAVVWPVPSAPPPASGFAPLYDATALPHVNAAGRRAYEDFLLLRQPRAFVIAPNGAWAVASRGFDPLAAALERCLQKHPGCLPYAINEQVVWPKPAASSP